MHKICYMVLFSFGLAFGLFAETTEIPPIAPPQLELPSNPEFDRFYGEFFKMLTMLGLIVVFLMALTWFVKRFLNTRLQQMNSGSLVQVVERRFLTPKTSIYVLEIMGKRVVIAESHSGVTVINEFSPSPTSSRFAQLLEEKQKPSE